MLVREAMQKQVHSVASSAVIADAAEIMRDNNTGMLPVFEDGDLTGVITDRDLVVRGLAVGKDPNFTAIGEVMTRQTAVVFEDQELSEAKRVMQESQVRRVPVLDRERQVVGVLSEVDLPESSNESASSHETLEVPRAVIAPSDS